MSRPAGSAARSGRGFYDYRGEQPVPTRSALLETVREALADGRVDLYLQPVVSLPQRRTVFYESFSRLRDETGRVMMPAEYPQRRRAEGLVSGHRQPAAVPLRADRAAAGQAGPQGRHLLQHRPGLLGDETFFPQFLEFLSPEPRPGRRADLRTRPGGLQRPRLGEARNMAKLADLGFRFSLDKVTDLDLDFQDLPAPTSSSSRSAPMLLDQLLDVDGRADA
jgi:cyclic-di-GMP phosphodiesterase TipF (flagellum assembly factor)